MKLGEQIKDMKESKRKWQKFIDKWNKRNKKISEKKNISQITL